MFGLVVIGPPGSGKSTFCDAISKLYGALSRPHSIINLDPANEQFNYKCTVDVRDLISVEDVMEELELGPNGALLYCMEFLEKNIQWLIDELSPLSNQFLIFDLPGQVELYTVHQSLCHILQKLQKKPLNLRLASVHLVDATFIHDPSRFISMATLALTQTIALQLPSINVLSKLDVVSQTGGLPLPLNTYSRLSSAEFIADTVVGSAPHRELTRTLGTLLDEHHMLNFIPMSALSREDVITVSRALDKALGYQNGLLGELKGRSRRDLEDLRLLVGEDIQQEDFDLMDRADEYGALMEEHLRRR
eukprot:gnl/Dysnectes_brevis/4338_a5779_844.p1 GENE.gnl/Dysnectes_brevis/4338_a5779_844~~gnl/Dysnectes_brevis/4338_a5779_844.p1  ORF type:complete len:305 (+),score=63.72 gnl/Dysnectes_brevis/4338_a5779_844:23-937(+)